MAGYSILFLTIYIIGLGYSLKTQTYNLLDEKTSSIKYSVNLVIVKHTTSSIIIGFHLTPLVKTENYQIRYQKEGTDRVVFINHKTPDAKYEIQDLGTNQKYNICVAAFIRNPRSSLTKFVQCVQTKTLPALRDDSIIALILTIAVLGLIILSGWLYWRHRFMAAQKALLDCDDDSKEGVPLTSDSDTTQRDTKPLCSIELPVTSL